jgi:carbon monoxide dehydrogenase subunit G
MAHLEITTFIAAPPEAVWEILADLEHQGAWMVDVRKLEVVTERKRGEGAIIHVTSELFGLPLVKDVMAITRWEPPHRMDVEHRGTRTGSRSSRRRTARVHVVEDRAPGRSGAGVRAVSTAPARVFTGRWLTKRLAGEK